MVWNQVERIMWTTSPIFGLTCLLNVCFSSELSIQQQLNQLNRRVSTLENDVKVLKVKSINWWRNHLQGEINVKKRVKEENANYKSIIENKEVEDDVQYLLAQNEEVKTKIDTIESQKLGDNTSDVNVNFSGTQYFQNQKDLLSFLKV